MPQQEVLESTDLEQLIEKKVQEALKKTEQGRRRLAIVASKGTLDMAYPPLILATTAAAMEWEVGVFCTFYGLNILKKNKLRTFKVSPLGNPAMPVPMPSLVSALPGIQAAATEMMKSWMRQAKIPPLQELLETALENGVHFYACTTTMGVMKVKKEEIITGATFAGAAGFLDFAAGADVTLFI